MPAPLYQKPATVMVILILSYFGNKTLSITCTTPFEPEISAFVTLLSLIFTPFDKSTLIFCPLSVATELFVKSVDITLPETT